MAKKAYLGVGGVARKVKKVYVGVQSKKYTLKNIAPTINGNTGFNAGSASTTHTKYASKSLMLTGTTSTVEVTATTTSSYPLVKGHKYYARVEIYQETVVGSSDFYWPIAEPSFYNGKVATAGTWKMIGGVSTRSSWDSGNYQIRIDFNNSNNAGYMWFDGLMLIDLTEAFGEGNEPTATWMKNNVPFFTGTLEVEKKTSSGVAREFKSGYVGVSGVARKVFPGGISLGDIAVGSIVYINENGSPVAFYVAKHDYESSLNGSGRTLLVRKDCYDYRVWRANQYSGFYLDSDIDYWLNNSYKSILGTDVQSAIGTTKFRLRDPNGETQGTRAVFLLSVNEIDSSHQNSDGSTLPTSNFLKVAYLNGNAVNWWSRAYYRVLNSKYYIYYFTSNGGVANYYANNQYCSRPCFTLPVTALFDPTTMQFLSA